jgi:hypothetical protein
VHRNLHKLDENDVRRAYKGWAPVYDTVFGKLVEAGVKHAAARANEFTGRLLEVGVGTGLALPHYGSQLKVTSIDLSTDGACTQTSEAVQKPQYRGVVRNGCDFAGVSR